MPSVFNSRFKRSGSPRLLRHFGEPIVYFLRDGGSRSITAIIERSPLAFYDAAGNVVLPAFVLRIKDDCTEGVKASEVDTGGDEVELIAELGDVTPTRKTVLKLMSQDSGVIVLALK